MSTHNIFYGAIRTIISKLSPNSPPQQILRFLITFRRQQEARKHIFNISRPNVYTAMFTCQNDGCITVVVCSSVCQICW